MSSIPGLATAEAAAGKHLLGRFMDIYAYVSKYDENVEQLRKKQETLVCQNEDISRQVEIGEQRLEIITNITGIWLGEVKELIGDETIGDITDEKISEGKDKCFFCLPFNIPYRYWTSKAAEKKAKQIQEAISRTPSDPITLPMNATDLESTPTEFLEGLNSRDEILSQALAKLQDDNVYSVGICGMGAIGKTTLAKEVKNKASGDFDLIVMAEISEVPNIDSIQEQIAESIGLLLNDCRTRVQRAERLYTRLRQVKAKGSQNEKRGKTLIIIDNIWESLNLRDVGILLDNTKECCCKILFTSRKQDVCRIMGVEGDNIILVPLLTEIEAKYLFHTRIGERDDYEDYKTLEDRLLNKCGGLPFAIANTANALKGKSLPMWRRFVNELESSRSVRGRHETYTIFETSYNMIENEDQKKFFLLASLFPPGSKISIDEMMRYGIGLGLFQYVDKLADAMDLAKSWVDELRSWSLLCEDESYQYVKIHNIVRESAIFFADKDGQKMMVETVPRWLGKETWANYTAISLRSVRDYNCLRGLKCDMLEILLLQGEHISESQKIEEDFFAGMENLKVLSLRNMNFEQSLPKSIATLKKLKTLMLEGCEMGDIKLVGDLKSLLVLSFKESMMNELPKEIGRLNDLRVLDLRQCLIRGNIISAGIILRFSQLEGLFLSDTCLNDVEMSIPHITQLPTSSHFIETLNKFRMFVGIHHHLKYMSPPGRLRQLSRVLVISRMDFNQVLKYTWLEVLLKKTEFLGLDNVYGLTHLAHNLDCDGFKDLKDLRVKNCHYIQCILSTDTLIGTIAFPNLESLFLSSMKGLKIIYDGVATPGTFSNLRDVSLKSLVGLEMYALPMNLVHRLTSLEVEDCQNLIYIFMMKDELCTTTVLPSLKKLILRDLPKLHNLLCVASSSAVSDPQVCQFLLHKKILLPSLEKLQLSNVSIRELWEGPTNEETCTNTDALSTEGSNVSYIESLRNLKHVEIKSCSKLESLGQPSLAAHLLLLETLYIYRCRKMSHVLTKETDEETPKRCIIFPNLRTLSLNRLDNLKSFYEGTHQLQFMALKTLSLHMLPRIVSVAAYGDSTTFFNEKIEFPWLEDLDMCDVRGEVEDVKELWRPVVAEGFPITISSPLPHLRNLVLERTRGLRLIPVIAFQQLSTLKLRGCDNKFVFSTTTLSVKERFVFRKSQTLKLEILVLQFGDLMEGLFENNLEGLTDESDVSISKICGQLRHLELWHMDKLNLIPLQSLKKLRSLSLYDLNWGCLFTSELITSIPQLLPLLEELRISHCLNMKIVLDDDEYISANKDSYVEFPRLRRLQLHLLDKATSFNSSANSTLYFPSLEELEIRECKFKSLFIGHIIAPKLRTLHLHNCSEMMAVLNATELLSLQNLDILECPGLKSFSLEPLEAPLLNQISVDKVQYPMKQIYRTDHPINNFLRSQHHERSNQIPDMVSRASSAPAALSLHVADLESTPTKGSKQIQITISSASSAPVTFSLNVTHWESTHTEGSKQIQDTISCASSNPVALSEYEADLELTPAKGSKQTQDTISRASSDPDTLSEYEAELELTATEGSKQFQDTIFRASSDPIALSKNVGDSETTTAECLDGLKSRERLLLQILDKLHDDQVYSVGVYGMGAIGKTTLMKEVQKKANDIFDLIGMAEISEGPNIDHIQEQIAESIGLCLDDCSNTIQRAQRLYTRLKQVKAKDDTNEIRGKSLIIIDNIWKSLEFEEIGLPFEQTKECCCKILFTSRKEDMWIGMSLGHDGGGFRLPLTHQEKFLPAPFPLRAEIFKTKPYSSDVPAAYLIYYMIHKF